MRVAVAVSVLALACTHPPAPSVRAPGPPPSPDVSAAVPAPRTPPTEAEILQRSHDVIDAFDRGDVPTVAAALGADFVHFEGGEPTERAAELDQMAKRKPEAPHIATRAWSHEHVYAHPDSAVFIGEAAEHMAGNDSHGGFNYDGWYTLAWRRDGNDWKLSLWTWRKGGSAAERDTWNEIFRNSIGFNHEPNRLLVETVKGKKPGKALDVAMGQGRNAIYLASQGWKVTGVDFSDEGLRLAQATAAARKLRLDVVNADVKGYDFGTAKWDLVTMIYAGDDVTWIDKIKPSLKRGGLFIVEYFHKDVGLGQKDGFATGQLAALFADGFEIVRDDVVEDAPDWAVDKSTLVRFVARKR